MKNRTKDHVSYIGQIKKKIEVSRDPDTSVFTFRFCQVPENLKKN